MQPTPLLMNNDLIYLLFWFSFGLGLIAFAGDGFVKSSVKIAEIFQIPALYIGTFLIGFSTSVPEISVTYLAASKGAIDLSIGNVLGSYILQHRHCDWHHCTHQAS